MPEKTADYQIVLKKNTSGDKTFNRPTVNEIAVLIVNGSDPNNKNSYRQIMLRNKDDTMSTINQCNMAYDPLQYVLLFPYGDYGWSPGAFSLNINNNQLNEAMLELDTDRTHINVDGDVEGHAGGQSDGNSDNDSVNNDDVDNEVDVEVDREIDADNNGQNGKKTKFVTAMQYYAYMIQQRNKSYLHKFGRLFHQYLCDQYSKIELCRLNYIRFNQDKIRAETYSGLVDAGINDEDFSGIGKRIVLPSSFTGCDRQMGQLFQDACSIVRHYNKPDLFVTITCNTQWKEIQDELSPNETANDRPDLICKVFNLKRKVCFSLKM